LDIIRGNIADVMLNEWSKTSSASWWFTTALMYILFMSLFGLVIRQGSTQGYPLTIAVVLVLLLNIGSVLGWDVLRLGTSISTLQWVGIFLAIGAFASFEFGRS